MNQDSTVRLSASDGSTSPHLQRGDYAAEAAQITARWRRQDAVRLAERFQNKEVLRRHKSLVLNLVLEDCQKLKNTKSSRSKPLDLIDRFKGLGHALEQSIYRQLEVQQYLEEHPELIQDESEFPWPEEGDRLDGYYVLEELGRGAMARVYLCRQEALAGRLVVVKLGFGIDPHEAALLGQLSHPYIVPVHTAQEITETGASLICMPFLGRSTLADLIALARNHRGPKPKNLILEAATQWLTSSDKAVLDTAARLADRRSYYDQLLSLALSVAQALQYAHTQGVLHGDIKPSNVLLTADCRPLLLDFNLGRELSQGTGPVGGTLPYMAPELLRALLHDPQEVMLKPTVATDVYSFGILLHELFTGTTPFQQIEGEDSVNAAQRALQIAEGYSSTMASQVDGNKSLWKLIDMCLSLRPENRSASMQEIANELRRELRLPRKVVRSTRKNQKGFAIGLGTILLASIGSVVFLANREPYFNRAYEAALVDFQNQHQQDAINWLDQALNSKPDHIKARLLRARIYLESGDLAKAKADLEILAKQQGTKEAAPLIGYLYNLEERHSQAIPWYESALESEPQSPIEANNLAMSWFLANQTSLDQKAKIEKAYHYVQKAVKLSPDSKIVRRNAVRIEVALALGSLRPVSEISRENLTWLCDHCPDDGEVNRMAFNLYSCWMQEDPKLGELAMTHLKLCHVRGTAPTKKALRTKHMLSALRDYYDGELSSFGRDVNRITESPSQSELPTPFLLPLWHRG